MTRKKDIPQSLVSIRGNWCCGRPPRK